MKYKALAAVICMAAATVAAHARTIDVYVSGYADGAPMKGAHYLLVPEQAQLQANQFELAEYFRSTDRLLAAKGMIRVWNPPEADVIVSLGYGIGNPNTQTFTTPVTTTPVQTTTNYNKVAPGIVTATTTQTGGITSGGSSFQKTSYTRFMRLIAVDVATFRTTNRVRERWRLEMKSEGPADDLRQILPAMAYSAISYVGTDTGKAVRVKVKEKDKDYQAFLVAPTPPPSPATPPPAPPPAK